MRLSVRLGYMVGDPTRAVDHFLPGKLQLNKLVEEKLTAYSKCRMLSSPCILFGWVLGGIDIYECP